MGQSGFKDSLKRISVIPREVRTEDYTQKTGFVMEMKYQYTGLLESGYREYMKDLNSYYSSDENALLVRLREYQENYTEWIRDFSIPTTNNLSERSLRFVKCKDKMSGQFLSESYAQYFANIRTYIETCARNGVNEFQALLRLTQNNPYSLRELLN
jgi:hypothetical protein